jgi:hypothetical protein
VPWPAPAPGTNPENYPAYDHTAAVSPPVRPANWGGDGSDWKLSSARSSQPPINQNPQELCGVEGNSVDTAWRSATGRPTTVIAILDSGIEWCNPTVVNKIYLNRAALPLPETAAGLTKPQLIAQGVHFLDSDPYDLNDSGVFNVAQYASDPRLAHPFFCAGQGHDYVSPEDLIRAFSGLGRQGPPGFTAAIAGWNFLDNSNDPYDDVHYDHGTGEAGDSSGAANTKDGGPGACPNCMVLPVRVGDSFISYGNEFAQAVAFAVDSGASLIQEALGTLDVTAQSQQAVDYAVSHGVPVIASAADEEAQHHNLPSNLNHTIVVNSTTKYPDVNGVPLYTPQSYLYLNGCTNYGANIAVTVESASCSSEATGKSSGVVGLLESEAADMLQTHRLAAYPGLRSANGQPVPLSANEVQQLVTSTADDIDFQTAAPPFGPPDNYAVVAPVPTVRYQTGPGFDVYTGYGRLNATTLLARLGAGDIPPEAQLNSPSWFDLTDPHGTLTVSGVVAAVRAQSYQYQVQVGVGPAPGSWTTVAQGSGHGRHQGTLAQVPLSSVAALFPSGTDFGSGPADASTARPAPDRFTFTVRLVVQDNHGRTGQDRRALFLHHDPSLLAGYPHKFDSSIDAVPTLAPLDTGGNNVLLVPTSGGTIHALRTDGSELPGWPVQTAMVDYHAGERAFASGALSPLHGGTLGGVAVGDLTDSGALDVVATDLTGRVYAWNAAGTLLAGFPVRTNASFSGPRVRDQHNRVLRGIFPAAALADLEGTGRLDIVAASMDRHLYAWRPDGTPLPGFPVIVVDRSQVQSIDPTTDKVTFKPGAPVANGTKVIDTPAVGALSGTGRPDLVVGSNEEYLGSPNVSITNPINFTVGQIPVLKSANSRVYAVDSGGHVLPGWPAAIADYDAELLPDVGDGTINSPALASVNGDGRLQTGVITTVGPAYVLNPDGGSFYGNGPDGKPRVLSMQPSGPLSNSPQHPSLPALGAPIFAGLGNNSGLSLVAPAASIGKAIDAGFPADQPVNDNQLDAWNLQTQHFQPGFPTVMNDLQFFVQPLVANVGGDSAGPYVVEGSATYDLRAVDLFGREAPGFPKFTGGWLVNSPSLGAFGTLANQVLAAGTREGYLFVWSTPTTRCADSGPWPRGHHDLLNTNNLQTTTAPHFSCPASKEVTGGGGLPLIPPSQLPLLPPPPAPLPTVPPGSAMPPAIRPVPITLP